MKGGRCFLCDRLVETDNEECLCNNCLSTVNGPTRVGRAILLALVIVIVLVAMSII